MNSNLTDTLKLGARNFAVVISAFALVALVQSALITIMGMMGMGTVGAHVVYLTLILAAGSMWIAHAEVKAKTELAKVRVKDE